MAASEHHENGLDKTRSFRALARGAVVSHYRIIQKVGEGGMGVVYKAEDTRLGRAVALKFLSPRLLCDPDAKARFDHEARAASALNHSNITTIYDIDEAEDRCFISMEYVEGKSVKELVKEEAVSFDQTLDVARQIGQGLSAAHKKGIVHRDIKSENIMLNREGVVKITDFGLAKLKGVTKLTKTGSTLGTLHYMSPEQAQGQEVDHRSDIFSFGVVMYEMLTGQLPFTGEHDAAVLHSIINEPHKPLSRIKPDVPRGLEKIVDKALRKEKAKRYESVDQLLSDLRDFSAMHQKTDAKPPKKRSSLIAAVSALAVGLLILLGYFTLKPEKATPPGRKMPTSASAGPTAEKKKSLAVMYFENVAGGERADLIRASLTDGLIANLSSIPQLFVVPKKEILDFKDTEFDPDKIVDKTGADYILRGTIGVIGETIGLSLQMLDVLGNTTMWSEKYTCSEKELFDFQDKVALDVFDTLGIDLSEEQRSFFRKKEKVNESAQKLIERGLYYYDNKLYPLALESFKQALEEDRSYFRTHYYMGQTYQAMEQWKEAIEEYQLALPESEKFRRVKFNYEPWDSVPPSDFVFLLRGGRAYVCWHEPEEKAIGWREFDLLERKTLFERRTRVGKGVVVPPEHGDHVCSFWHKVWTDSLPNTHVYVIDEQGDLLWEFADTSCDFGWCGLWGDYVTAEEERGESTYVFDMNGRLATKMQKWEYGKWSDIEDDYLLSCNRTRNVIELVDLREPDKIDTMRLNPEQRFIRWLGDFIILKNDSTSKIEAYRTKGLVKDWDFEIPRLEASNCAPRGTHVFCFSNDSHIYALKLRKPFYSGRVDWRTFVGQPCSTQALSVRGDTLIAFAQDGQVRGLDTRTGKVLWNVNIGERVTQLWRQVCACDNRLLLLSSSEIAVFDLQSGRLEWFRGVQKPEYYFVKSERLLLAWTDQNVLSGLSFQDGTALFKYRTTRSAGMFGIQDRVFVFDQNHPWVKELNVQPYAASGRLREDQILKSIALCCFEMGDYDRADSLLCYVIEDLGIEDPESHYYLYVVGKKKEDSEAALAHLEDYYDLIRDTKDKEAVARKVFADDFAVSILSGRALRHREHYSRVFDLDSLVLVANSTFRPRGAVSLDGYAMYVPGDQRLWLNVLDKSAGLSVWEAGYGGMLPDKLLPRNRLLFRDYHYDMSGGKVDFSFRLLDLATHKLMWDSRVIETVHPAPHFELIRADSNYICAYFRDPPKTSNLNELASDDSADFHFYLLRTQTGEIETEKIIRLPSATNDRLWVYADDQHVFVPYLDRILLLDAETFGPSGQIVGTAPVTGFDFDQDVLYLGTRDNFYSAYDRNTTDLMWRFKLPFPLEDFEPAVFYLRDSSFLDWNSRSLFSIDIVDNTPPQKRVSWRFDLDSVCPECQISWSSDWRICDDKVYLRLRECDKFSYVVVDRRNGKFLRGLKLPWIEEYGSQVFLSGDTLYCLTADGVFYKVGCF